MPEPIRSEEDVNREHSLCLFNGTVLNRCSNCPGAATSRLQNRRCPFDDKEPSDHEDPVKSLESSSSEVPEAESLSVGALSLADSTASETSSDTAGDPSQVVGSKRKVYQTIEAYLKNKAPKLFEDFRDSNPNKHMNQLMRISEENHEAASPSMISAGFAAFSLDTNKPGVRATRHDMEIDETQMR